MNLLDYVEWRGDLTFKKSAFCDVDALVLCQLSYLNFDGLLSSDFARKTSLWELWTFFKTSDDFEKRSDLGALISKQTVDLLEACAKSARFGKLYVSGYISKIDLQNEEQFSAMTFFDGSFSSNPFVAFRGTDDTIVGWKEDFNLAIEEAVPAQRDALAYLEGAAKKTRGKIFVGGHSKGGNLAVYASAFCAPKCKKRIARVFNFDGPGFRKEIIGDARLKQILPLLHSYYPKFSIVGMLFRRAGQYSIVDSPVQGLMQHEAFNWLLGPSGFVTLDGFDAASDIFHKTFNEWLEGISKEKRALVIETLFKVLTAGGAKTNSDLGKDWFKQALAIVKAAGELDKETRDEVLKLVQHLFDVAARNIKERESESPRLK
ncbi:MAG: DUF2974 domain-containing protein [Treponema sp.]|nr:DUF2974 domain-containing protein [Treponema sp.]